MKSELREDREFLLRELSKIMKNLIEDKIPAQGYFSPRCLLMEYPGSEHTGKFTIKHSELSGCALLASFILKDTDTEISNYIFTGSREDCITWLDRPENLTPLVDIFDALAENADSR